MLDYWKIWIYDKHQIETVLRNGKIKKNFTNNEEAELIGISAKYLNWKIKTLTSNCLQISGSIHKYWNCGTNENDFPFNDAVKAINRFCEDLNIDPSLAFLKNLEFGVNLQLEQDASELLEQIICFNYNLPITPYTNRPDRYFMEFSLKDYYLKCYDKGKQARENWNMPGTPNTLRLEIKGMNSRFLQRSNVETLADLFKTEVLQVLALNFAKLVKGIVFDDDTIDLKEMPLHDRKLYRDLSNPRKWKRLKGCTNSTSRARVKRFMQIVEKYGKRKIYSLINKTVNEKIVRLSNNERLTVFLPNTYTLKTDKTRRCKSCGRDITHQHKNSLFCSAKYVGQRQAKKCRNLDSNPRNNRRLKIEKIKGRGVLFDIEPYLLMTQSG